MNKQVVIIAGGLGLLVALVGQVIAQASFSGDDGHMLQLAAWHPFWHYIINPETYQLLSVKHFTPLVPALYQGMLMLFGVSPAAFFGLQALLLTLSLFFLLKLITQRTGSILAVLVFCLAIIAVGSLPTLLLRNYTLHYLLGGVFTAFWLWRFLPERLLPEKAPSMFLRKDQNLTLFVGLPLLAFLSKEIYLPLFALMLLFTLIRSVRGGGIDQEKWTFLFSAAVLVLYFIGRGWMLDLALPSKDSAGFLAGLRQINLAQWQHFFTWYGQHHWGLLLLVLIAFGFNFKGMLRYSLLAGLFLAPLVAAPHGFLQPEFHADRLLYPFHIGLALAQALALGERFKASNVLSNKNILIVAGGFWLVLLFRMWLFPASFPGFEAAERVQVRQLIQQVNAEHRQGHINSPQTPNNRRLVPPTFKLSGLMSAYQVFADTPVTFTPNCFSVLQQAGDTLPVAAFWQPEHQHAGLVTRHTLEQQCLPLDLGDHQLKVIQPVSLSAAKHLRWHVAWPKPGVQVGVFFPARGLMIATAYFDQPLVRPLKNERYQWVIRDQNHWWFSEPQPVIFEP